MVLAADIFGRTDALEVLAERLNAVCENVRILDPYAEKLMNFHNEEEAYETFNRLCGLERYAQACQKTLDVLSNEEIVLIGFSMGASALWKALDGRNGVKIKHFFGFYASQIRHMTELNVDVETTLLFPKSETHFDVDRLMQLLVPKQKITCLKTPYLHGFMNSMSVNYDSEGYHAYSRWLEEKLKSF